MYRVGWDRPSAPAWGAPARRGAPPPTLICVYLGRSGSHPPEHTWERGAARGELAAPAVDREARPAVGVRSGSSAARCACTRTASCTSSARRARSCPRRSTCRCAIPRSGRRSRSAAAWAAVTRTCAASGAPATSPGCSAWSARTRRCSTRFDGGARARQRVAAPAGSRPAPQQPARQPAQHPRALRPGQRLLRAVPRSDADVLGGRVRARRRDDGGGVGREERADLPEARAVGRRSRARDRHRLGRLRDPRGAHARLQGHHHHALARAARGGAGAGGGRAGCATGSRSCSRTIATCAAASTSWCRSR